MILISIKDKLSNQYSPVQLEHNAETAIRSFKRLLKESPVLSQSPSDYELCYICDFDFDLGVVILGSMVDMQSEFVTSKVQTIARGSDFVNSSVGLATNKSES